MHKTIKFLMFHGRVTKNVYGILFFRGGDMARGWVINYTVVIHDYTIIILAQLSVRTQYNSPRD